MSAGEGRPPTRCSGCGAGVVSQQDALKHAIRKDGTRVCAGRRQMPVPGDRVRHYGQQYPSAYRRGAGALLAVEQRGRFREYLCAWDDGRVSYIAEDAIFVVSDAASEATS